MSAESKRVRWGVLGYARIAREEIIPAIQRSHNSEFYGIASRDEGKLAECRARFKPQAGYKGYQGLVDDPGVDAVYIPLPNSMHREWTIKAAERGKHVLCEKPMGLTLRECKEMRAACEGNGVLLMEAFMYRYSDLTRRVIEVVRSGVLGEIKFISSTFRFLLSNPASIKLKPELGGGSLYDVGCYPINFTGMVGDEIERLRTGDTAARAPWPESISVEYAGSGGVDLICSVLLRYPSGLVASLNSGFNAQKRVYSEIVGEKGALEVPETFFGNAGALTITTVNGERQIPVGESDRYRLEIEDFAEAIQIKRAPMLTLDETERNAELMDRIIRAKRFPGHPV